MRFCCVDHRPPPPIKTGEHHSSGIQISSTYSSDYKYLAHSSFQSKENKSPRFDLSVYLSFMRRTSPLWILLPPPLPPGKHNLPLLQFCTRSRVKFNLMHPTAFVMGLLLLTFSAYSVNKTQSPFISLSFSSTTIPICRTNRCSPDFVARSPFNSFEVGRTDSSKNSRSCLL